MRKTWIKTILLAILGLGLALLSNWAQAAIYDRSGNKIPDADVNSSQVNWELLSAEKSRKYNGIGLLEQESEGFCTAFFLNTGGDDNAPAYAVTNGHCADIHTEPAAKEILINRPSNKVFKLNYFVNAKSSVRPVHVRQVVYATMKSTDISILELDTTFNQLVKEGFTPWKIAEVPPSIGEPIEVIGIPMTGVKSSLSYLHRTNCQVGQVVNLREGVYHWEQAIRTRCSVVGGMSGSPVVSLRSNQVVAIANTGVDDKALKQPECSKNRPCELFNDGRVATFPKENYAQRVYPIPSCFDKKGIFNLNLPSCGLEKP
ncbi:MAG TPA: serine protease, partial [Cyanobacteria bacterium UBA8543]|nr:serine protease [Cyanobacteria bacterium UBA8543]